MNLFSILKNEVQVHLYKTMSYSRSYKPGKTEKRLSSLRQQLYGKSITIQDKSAKSSPTYSYVTNSFSQSHEGVSTTQDLQFLKVDMFKIMGLALLGIGVQILIYFGLKSNLIKIAF